MEGNLEIWKSGSGRPKNLEWLAGHLVRFLPQKVKKSDLKKSGVAKSGIWNDLFSLKKVIKTRKMNYGSHPFTLSIRNNMMIRTILVVLCAAAPAASGFAMGSPRTNSVGRNRRRLATTTAASSSKSSARKEEGEMVGPVSAAAPDAAVVPLVRRGGDGRSRRDVLLGTIVAATVVPLATWSSSAAAAPKLRPDDAFASLVAARGELRYAADTYLPKSDWEGMREYLESGAANMNNYENSAQALLESKRLDAESKRDIGTIRRYGVGADVIIMYGGLKNELSVRNDADVDDEGGDGGGGGTSGAEVGKYLRRTADSLEEVLAICRSNGFT